MNYFCKYLLINVAFSEKSCIFAEQLCKYRANKTQKPSILITKTAKYMEILLLNTTLGLIPVGDESYDNRKKLKLNVVYKVDIKEKRNYLFHKKYFALINTAWEFQSEESQKLYNNSVTAFRKTIEIAAGHFEPIWNIKANEWQQAPKSICFDKMDEFAFQELYKEVKNIIFAYFLDGIDEKEFNSILEQFD